MPVCGMQVVAHCLICRLDNISIHTFTDEVHPMQLDDQLDEFTWLEEQEKGVRQSIENLHAEIAAYERQLGLLRERRVRARRHSRRDATSSD